MLALAGVACLAFMDAGLKWLSDDYPPTQLFFFRVLLALPIVLVWHAWGGSAASLWPKEPVRQLPRVACLAGSSVLFIYSYRFMPLADAIAISMAAPLLVTLLAAKILRERPHPIDWVAIFLGLAGVIAILRPGGSAPLLAAVACSSATLLYSVAQVLTRRDAKAESPESITVFYCVVSAGALAPVAAFVWVAPSVGDLAIMLLVGSLGGLGLVLLASAYRLARASKVVIAEYTGLIWAMLLGYVVWSDVPTTYLIAGALLIVLGDAIVNFKREPEPSLKQRDQVG